MRHHDNQTHDERHGAHDRPQQLLAAAEALRNWVYEQRENWPSEPVARGDSGHAAEVMDTEVAQAASWRASLSVFSGLGAVEESAPEAEESRARASEGAIVEAPAPEAPPKVVKPTKPEVSRPGLLNLHASPSVPAEDNVEVEPGFLASVRDSVARWAVRGSMAAALVGLLGWGGLSARTYWRDRPPTPPKVGTAILESVPAGLEVRVDGKVAGKTPLSTELPVGRHVVEFWRRNSSRRLEIDIKAGKSTVERLDWAAKRKGSLEVLSDPEGATVIVDGTSRGVTPLTIDDLSIGSHAVVLESAAGSLRRTVEIAADRVAQVTEAIYSGWLHVSSPIELQVSERTRRLLLDDRNQILLPPGAHELRFENPALGYRETRSVEVKPGAITSISIAPPPSVLTINASLPAEILVDGQRIGETPLLEHPIPIGTRVVVVKSITGAERRFTITVTAKPVLLDIDFSKP